MIILCSKVLTCQNNGVIILNNEKINAVKRSSKQLAVPVREMSVGARHRERIVELAVERLRRNLTRVVADGNSRDRVKLYTQLRAPCF